MLKLAIAKFLLGIFKSSLPDSISLNICDLSVLLFPVFIKTVSI